MGTRLASKARSNDFHNAPVGCKGHAELPALGAPAQATRASAAEGSRTPESVTGPGRRCGELLVVLVLLVLLVLLLVVQALGVGSSLERKEQL